MRTVGSAMAERWVPPSVSWTRMRSPRWVAGSVLGSSEPRSRGALGALTSDRAYDAAAARADAHLDAYAYGTNRRDDAEVSSQFGRMSSGSGLAGDGDARSRGAVVVGDALVTMMLLQRDSSAATRAAPSDGSRAVVLRGALFRERRMGRTGDSRAHVEVPLRRQSTAKASTPPVAYSTLADRARRFRDTTSALYHMPSSGQNSCEKNGRGSGRRRCERLRSARAGRNRRALETEKKNRNSSCRAARLATAAARRFRGKSAQEKIAGAGGKARKRPCEVGARGSRRTSMWALFRGVRLPSRLQQEARGGLLDPRGVHGGRAAHGLLLRGRLRGGGETRSFRHTETGSGEKHAEEWTRGSSAPPRPRRAPFCCPWSWRTPCQRESRTPSAAS